MKKQIALILAACLMLLSLCACGETPVVSEETTTAPTTDQTFEIEDGELKSCVGQADENGVYVVPSSVSFIGESAFYGDTTLKEIVIGESVTEIASGAFQGCTALKKVTFEGDSLTVIGSHAFYGCTALEQIDLPETVTRAESYVFYGCTALESASLPGVRVISTSAFQACTALETVVLSEELEQIGAWAFSACAKLETINMEDCAALTRIGNFAFAACSMLTELSLPASLESIGMLAFYDCTRLVSLSIPASVKTVDFCALTYTPWYQENSEDYLIVGDGVLVKCNVHPAKLSLEGRGIKSIGNATFWNAEAGGESADYGYKYASALEEITLPDGLETVGTSAFAGCEALQKVTLPASVTRIEANAFNVCASEFTEALVDFTACKALSYIGSYAFYGCGGIEAVTLPETVDYVGAYAFAGTQAYFDFLDRAKDTETEEARYWIEGNGVLLGAYVADGQTALHIPEGVRVIGNAAFCGWDNAVVPSSDSELSTSGESKYRLTYQVSEVVLPSTLETICDSAFYRMSLVKSLVLPDSLTYIGDSAFAFCDALTSLSGGGAIKTIGSSAFSYCTSILSFRFSSNTEEIGESIFVGCSALQSVYLPKGLAFPGTTLFSSDCTALETLYVSPEARPRIFEIVGGVLQNLNLQYYKEK